MASKHEEPSLLFPALKPFYERAIPLSWLVVRFAVAWNLLVHAYFSIGRGPLALAPVFEKMGFVPGNVFSATTFAVELLGGIGILLGLFTRFFAAAVAIEMLVIFFVYWNAGFSWLRGGYEYALLWGLVSFAIALRGGGPYSLDRKLGREL
jgi:putative oxidoreductase